VSDLAVTAGDALVYDLNLNPVGEGTVTIQVPTNSISDVATNFNDAASNVLTFVFDTTNPTVAVSTPTASYTKHYPIEYVLVFSETMFSVTAADLTLTGGSTTDGDIVEDPANTFTVQITPDDEGVVEVSLLQDAVTDLALNGVEASATLSWTFDTTRPDVVLTLTLTLALTLTQVLTISVTEGQP